MADDNAGGVGDGLRQRELPDVVSRKFSAVDYSLVGGVVNIDAGARVGGSLAEID